MTEEDIDSSIRLIIEAGRKAKQEEAERRNIPQAPDDPHQAEICFRDFASCVDGEGTEARFRVIGDNGTEMTAKQSEIIFADLWHIPRGVCQRLLPKDLAIFHPNHELKCAICDGLSYFICVRTSFSLAATRQGPFPNSELVPRPRLSQDGLTRQTTFAAASANQRLRDHNAHKHSTGEVEKKKKKGKVKKVAKEESGSSSDSDRSSSPDRGRKSVGSGTRKGKGAANQQESDSSESSSGELPDRQRRVREKTKTKVVGGVKGIDAVEDSGLMGTLKR